MAQELTLPDGRKFWYLISGAEDGFPMFFIHGTPGGFVAPVSLPAACEKKGIKLITACRSGYGDSTRSKGRNIADAILDTDALRKHLGIEKCIVGGWSGGGPHALACAARLPGCVAVLCVAGVAPYDAKGLDWLEGVGQDSKSNIDETEAALKGEDALRELLKNLREEMLAGDPESIVKGMESLLPEVDKKAILDNPDMGQNMMDMVQEAFKNSIDGYVDDSMAFVKPWGFSLDEIKAKVFIYQGDLDLMVSLGHGKWLSKNLPQDKVVAHFLEGEGHISIFMGRIDQMLDELLAEAKKH